MNLTELDFRHQCDKYPDELDDAINQLSQELDELGREELNWNRYPWGGVVDVLRFRRGERRGSNHSVRRITARSHFRISLNGGHEFDQLLPMLLPSIHNLPFETGFPCSTAPVLERLELETDTDAIEKVRKRGWKMINSGSGCNALSRHSDLNMFLRRVGDRHCWTIPLDPVNDFVMEGPLQLGRSESSFKQSWRLIYASGRASLREGTSLLDVGVLKRSYLLEPKLLPQLGERLSGEPWNAGQNLERE
ncbi:hypothetical protein AAF712_010388 [Marasmius tenuissimus]|uniref:Uncharacterized protein n=1 Tax=Marasmius tenuissimus TaxID=585030 RepID=A0ABR2ZM69_9AGAR